jgi:nucleoside-diphosphate-sugar epimerase
MVSKIQPASVSDALGLGKARGDFSAATIGQKTVCVTGASGYVAGWCVKLLLELGHKVKGTVRTSDSSTVKHLHAMQNGNLELVEGCDLMVEGSFNAACDGCDVVLHTASPFEIAAAKDPQKKFVEPAIQGTLNVLRSCTKAGVKTVVQTSSVVAVYGDAAERGVGHTYTEADWNMHKDPKQGRGYSYSKKVAEEACVNYAKENPGGFKLLHINPGLVVGPSTSTRVNKGSFEIMTQFLTGKHASGAPPVSLGIVDVRDVGWAHIAAAFNPGTCGGSHGCLVYLFGCVAQILARA